MHNVIDSKSDVAPFRVVNIGNSKPKKLLDFIKAIEKSVGVKAVKNLLPLQTGDVPSTWADTSLLERLTGYRPATDVETGVQKFVSWYRNYYNVWTYNPKHEKLFKTVSSKLKKILSSNIFYFKGNCDFLFIKIISPIIKYELMKW